MTQTDFWKGRRVFLTGHTGFKGSWMCRVLERLGAEVTGFALPPEPEASLFALADVEKGMRSVTGDVRDLSALQNAMRRAEPEIVLHLAAQPLVRLSYDDPVLTYSTNVMGTVHVLEAVRACPSVRSFVNVTTDKVYRNNEWEWGYRETDVLDGYDPYSNSKSCSELVTSSYRNAFFSKREGFALSTARAGNVIGGGDFARDRIIPDCVRAALAGTEIVVRNPYSVRPYQHVLEPVCAYLLLARRQFEQPALAGNYNIGPDDCDCVTTGTLVELFCEAFGGIGWKNLSDGGPHEAGFLKLDCSRVKKALGWKPRWGIAQAVAATVAWTRVFEAGGNIPAAMDEQIDRFLEDAQWQGI